MRKYCPECGCTMSEIERGDWACDDIECAYQIWGIDLNA